MCRLSYLPGAALAAFCAASVCATTLAAEDATTDIGTLDKETADKAFPTKPPYSPYAGRNFPTRPYFGDTHTHTSFSMDAGAFGARLGPKEAYRFAKGEEVMASSRRRVNCLERSISWLLPITPTTWASSRNFLPAPPTCWQIRQAVVGTT